MSSLLNSNRNKHADVKPKRSAHISDLDKKLNQSSKKNKLKKVEYNSTLSIGNHAKNKLQAMVLIGDAKNQKEGFDIALDAYYESLPKDKKSMFKIFYNSLEQRDAEKFHGKK
ncbi:hypothetical protein WR164_16050 [Philodulcilactobacillus myokoensis]|uniref:Uncharacterized protein n=1 Tax=Philodulcilactobacillus myokoensis TaxID=2929573 RepID=A0A9W6B3N0_9LACO|nr:DUF5388 domain-containing protein [Philodulcilactobacillus myokoensis]GLB47626.1 hypothetical protein WR164_16050 [Philodulcilactobacillus myokoensis]